eukprot:Ihof_evm6s259 gene=Ihof_evmTU6s259
MPNILYNMLSWLPVDSLFLALMPLGVVVFYSTTTLTAYVTLLLSAVAFVLDTLVVRGRERKKEKQVLLAGPGFVLGVSLVPTVWQALSLVTSLHYCEDSKAILVSLFSTVATSLAVQALLGHLGIPQTTLPLIASITTFLVVSALTLWGPPLAGVVALSATGAQAVVLWAAQGPLMGCFTTGEAMVIAQFLALVFGDIVAVTVAKVAEMAGQTTPGPSGLWIRPTGYCCGVAAIWGMLAAGIILQPLIRAMPPAPSKKRLWLGLCFTLGLVGIAAGLLMPWAWVISGQFPVTWLLSYLGASHGRPALLALWGTTVTVAVAAAVVDVGGMSKARKTLARKYYHLLAVILFVPGISSDLPFMALAFAGAVAIFIAAEYYRACEIEPVGKWLKPFMQQYADQRDQGPAILSHIYLLLGCAMPVWLHLTISGCQDLSACQRIAPYSGLISLGIGDTFASVVGSCYGKRRWHAYTSKTMAGTAAAVISQTVTCAMLVWWTSLTPLPLMALA